MASDPGLSLCHPHGKKVPDRHGSSVCRKFCFLHTGAHGLRFIPILPTKASVLEVLPGYPKTSGDRAQIWKMRCRGCDQPEGTAVARTAPSALGTCASLPAPAGDSSVSTFQAFPSQPSTAPCLLCPPSRWSPAACLAALPCPGRALSTPRVPPPVFKLGVTVEASRGKTGVGIDTALSRFCCFFPSCQLLFGAQFFQFNINGFTLPLSFQANMLQSTENSPASDQEKSWIISSRGAGGFCGDLCPHGGSADLWDLPA